MFQNHHHNYSLCHKPCDAYNIKKIMNIKMSMALKSPTY